jgi:predicted nucleic acid-binding protein
MARRVILDAGVLIAIERGKLDVDEALGTDDAAIAAITAMELLAGVGLPMKLVNRPAPFMSRPSSAACRSRTTR